jgi:hypothetical protein
MSAEQRAHRALGDMGHGLRLIARVLRVTRVAEKRMPGDTDLVEYGDQRGQIEP